MNRLRVSKNEGYTREKTDWWFPLWTDESSNRLHNRDTRRGNLKAHMIPLFAALGITGEDFETLMKLVRFKWKQPNAFGFGVVFYDDSRSL